MFHNKLIKKLKFYSNWHKYPKHNHFHWLIVFLIALISCSSLLIAWQADSDLYSNLKQGMVMGDEYGTGFEARRQAFLDSDGGGYYKHESAIWAWLERDDGTRDQEIHQKLMQWGTDSNQCTCDDGILADSNNTLPSCDQWWPCGWDGPGWTSGWNVSAIHLLRALLQYEDVIDGSDYGWIERKIKELDIPQSFPHEGYDLNNQIMFKVIEYLRAEYLGGSEGNSEEWLNNMFNELTTSGQGNSELDSSYTKVLIMSLYTLYDFTDEGDEMNTKAKMLLDFILLDSILDVSVELHGGHVGRSRAIELGDPRVYHWIYWGIGPDPRGNRMGSFYDAYVSKYRLPALIYDIGRLDDEPDNYWHFNKENNNAGHDPGVGRNGKWNYVTPYYNMGGSYDGSSGTWMLGLPGRIRLWIDGNPGGSFSFGEADGRSEYYFKTGKGGYQNEQAPNAIFIKDAPYLHIVNTNSGNLYNHSPDESDGVPSGMSVEYGKWRFLRTGNVVVAINLAEHVSALEVGIIGVDYPSYQSFKDAIGSMDGDGFTTGKGVRVNLGDTIKASKRLETIINPDVARDNYEQGDDNYIVYWNDAGRIATVQHHDLACEYNFSEWETDEDEGCMSEEYEEYEPYYDPGIITIVEDDVLPNIVSFTVEGKDINESPVTSSDGSANIAWNVIDEGGSHLQKVEVWTAPDANGSPGKWKKSHTKIITGNADSHQGSFAHFIAKGTYWYGLHVYDKSENHRTAEDYSKGPIQLIQTKETVSLTACNNNTKCEAGENSVNCPNDCNLALGGNVTVTPICNKDGDCGVGESTINCPNDCPPQASVCDYDGICDAGESIVDCPSDCNITLGGNVTVEPTCDNDNICEPGENTANCANDCPAIVFQQSIMPDFNCDKKVNIQDFAILLTRWGKTDNLDNYNHSQCNDPVSLNIVMERNNGQETIDLADFGRLLSCWGTPQAGSCYE